MLNSCQLAHLLGLLLLLISAILPAQAGEVALILSESGGPYAEFARVLGDALHGSRWRIQRTLTAEAAGQANLNPDLIVAAGSEAFRQALRRGGNLPVLATLLPRRSYERLLQDNGQSGGRSSAIYLDQPLARQAAFVRLLLPAQRKVALLYSPETQAQLNAVRHGFTQAGFSLSSEEVLDEDQLLGQLNNLLGRSDLLLAIPDSSLYRREQIKPILMSSYRLQKPVIAFSAAFVHAGALAAIYSSPAQAARQAAELLQQHGTQLPPPQPPAQFAIAINRNVAQALNLTLPDEDELRSKLTEREAR